MSKDGDLIGTRIREYEILDMIGKGGMGAVYRARHVYLDEERAIKVIEARLAEDPNFVDRFIREAKILTRLRHENLVQIYEFGTLEENTFFMVLEFLRGESVLARMRRSTLIPIQESIRIVREAALGLHSAHEIGIIHRDISPDNLLLVQNDSSKEITKVIDFGIAKPLFEGGLGMTRTNVFMGKPEYCSPEQCGMLEEGEIIDRRSDIYSLAVTFYHMISGKLPFSANSPQAYIVKHAKDAPTPISSHFPQDTFPKSLERLLEKALSKKREDRHESMQEFVKDLDRIAFSEQATLDFQIPPPTPQSLRFLPGSVFARRYLIEKKIGEGGMGVVYKSLDRMLEIPVALKIMSPHIAENEKTLERFKREVILARRVAHRNVCRIYDIGESEGVHYVSMEFLEGRNLAEILQERPLTPNEGIPILKQVLTALQEAHRAGIIHRDLKPQNIMVDPAGRTSIMDFGISISADTRRITHTDALVGTPHYMAPEQLEQKQIDHRTDIYSMGVILYETFTGRRPFDGTTPVGIVLAHLKTNPPRPSSIVSDLPPELERIIMKSLEKDPRKRYQDIHTLLGDLETAETPSLQGSSKKKTQVIAGMGAILLLLMGLLIWKISTPGVPEVPGISGPLQETTPVSKPSLFAVNITALPWARIKVLPVSAGIKIPEIPEKERVTPCFLSLPEGEYQLELSNDTTTSPLIEQIKVYPGGNTSFLFTMPAYDVDLAVTETEKMLE